MYLFFIGKFETLFQLCFKHFGVKDGFSCIDLTLRLSTFCMKYVDSLIHFKDPGLLSL